MSFISLTLFQDFLDSFFSTFKGLPLMVKVTLWYHCNTYKKNSVVWKHCAKMNLVAVTVSIIGSG